MSDHHIQFCMLIVQTVAFLGLVYYCYETYKLRKASEKQVTASQKLIKASMDQVEGLSKPCLSLASELRSDLRDVILEGIGSHLAGTTQAALNGGNFVVQNLGNGIALNISYNFVKHSASGASKQGTTRYIQNLLAEQKVPVPEYYTLFPDDCTVVLEYESIGGRKYKSTLQVKGTSLALTAFKFECVAH